MLGYRRLSLAVLLSLVFLLGGCLRSTSQAAATRPLDSVKAVEQFWPDGKIRLRKHVLKKPDGTLLNHGTYLRWYDNGQKEYESTFVRGMKHGTATLWHRNGGKWTEEHYFEGKKHGARHLWDQSGTKRKEEHFVNGKPHGTWTTWKESGEILWQQGFNHGIPQP